MCTTWVEESLFRSAAVAYLKTSPFAMARTKDILSMTPLHSACHQRSRYKAWQRVHHSVFLPGYSIFNFDKVSNTVDAITYSLYQF
jgi:hypothetical protein